MANEQIIAGLDIGSSTIRIVIGQIIKTNESEQLNIIGVVDVPAQGLNKGSIVSIEDSVSSISACLEKAERMIGLPIESVFVGIGGTHIQSQESNGVIAITKTSGEISEADVERVIESARSVAAPVNHEVLHVIPKTFSIDNQTGVKDPVGMSGIRLEVTTQVVRGLSSQISNVTKSVYRAGIDINDLVFASLAASESVLNVRQKELGVALVDIGASTSKMAIYEEGDLVSIAVLPVGSDHITADLAIGLQTSLDVAERIKVDIGSASPKSFEKDEEVNLRDFGGDDQTFSKKYIAEIVEARAEEIFEKVDAELQKINRSGLLPAGLVLIGGGSKLSGIIEVAKRKTMLPVALGASKRFNTAVDKVNESTYCTALGLVLWGFNQGAGGGNSGWHLGNLTSVKHAADKVKGWFKNLVS
jgi:cell division protein FtsA